MAKSPVPSTHGGARPNSGGKRLGAGRKPQDPTAARVQFAQRIHPDTMAVIVAAQKEGESLGVTLDRLLAKKKRRVC